MIKITLTKMQLLELLELKETVAFYETSSGGGLTKISIGLTYKE